MSLRDISKLCLCAQLKTHFDSMRMAIPVEIDAGKSKLSCQKFPALPMGDDDIDVTDSALNIAHS